MDASIRTAGDVAAEIELSRMNWKGAFLVVEGPTDFRFWNARKNGSCDIVITQGRLQVIGAIGLLNARHFRGALGVVDCDDDGLEQADDLQNVVRTEPRDLEGLLLRSSALEKTLSEYGNAAKIAAFLATEGGTIRDALLSRALLFGKCRWLNQRTASVCLKKLKPQRFCNIATWTYDTSAIKDEAVNLGVATNRDELEGRLAELPPADPWHVCVGHDLVDILVGGLLSTLGDGFAKNPLVEAMLRAAFEHAEFQATELHARVIAWQAANQPYVIV